MSLTQRVLAGATGIHTRPARMPYSSSPAAVGDGRLAAMRVLGADGYLPAFVDLDVIQSVAAAVLGARLRRHTIRREGIFDSANEVEAVPGLTTHERAGGPPPTL
ncbi:hypothetical protein GCM10009530_60910 [Microbispora corallina]|uniref:Uncharacterized protein n=1 Tax=Microbispora corallina TaxID=83302 RepID=A0ABQ4FZ23_9ACTN|nr:hypothetical protein [Microbispora corallina]GIH40077.1 hypothetical protein Mco01_30770 [Microbispora corallina]